MKRRVPEIAGRMMTQDGDKFIINAPTILLPDC
jgi:hypothetical protein